MSNTIAPPKAGVTRRQALMPHLMRLHKLVLIHPTASSTQTLEAGGHDIRINPWEWSALVQGFKETVLGRNFTQLVAEAIAYQTRAFENLKTYATAKEQGTATAFDGSSAPPLAIDVAIGAALLDDLAIAIEGLRKSGAGDKAEALTQFSGRFRTHYERIREGAGTDLCSLGDGLVSQFPRQEGALLEQPQTPRASAPTPEGSAAGHSQQKGWWARQPAKTKDRIQLSVIGAMVAAGVATTLFVIPVVNRKELPAITQTAFSRFPEIEQVIARAPNLFVRVSGERWNTMDTPARQRMVDDVVKQAQAAGYAGAHINTSSGTPLARWGTRTGLQYF